ncbi:MAG: hypothetical protein KF836_08305 [Fimbriimonadaceae bacterium]|nr:hypothetical protein [Fimbriimonadaceae bacterium]
MSGEDSPHVRISLCHLVDTISEFCGHGSSLRIDKPVFDLGRVASRRYDATGRDVLFTDHVCERSKYLL